MKGSTGEFDHFAYEGTADDIGHNSSQTGSPFVHDESVITVVVRRSAAQDNNCSCCYLASTLMWPNNLKKGHMTVLAAERMSNEGEAATWK